MNTKELEKNALLLNPLDKIHLVEKLLTSLDKPDSAIGKVWMKETEARLHAYECGELKTVSYDTVKKKLKRQKK